MHWPFKGKNIYIYIFLKWKCYQVLFLDVIFDKTIISFIYM